MSDKERHVRWILNECKRKGYNEFAKAIDGVLQAEGVDAAFKYIQINAAVQKMMLDEWGGGMSA